MKDLSSALLLFLSITLVLISCNSQQKKSTTKPSATQKARAHILEIHDSWVRPAPNGGNSAAYLTIENGTTTTDTLKGIRADWTDKAELHESYTDSNGMSGMRPAGNQPVPAGGQLQLRPGKFHIMLMRVKRTLAAGDSVRLTLRFSINGTKSITVPVQRTAHPPNKERN